MASKLMLTMEYFFEHWGGQVKWHVSFIRDISIKIGNVNQNARQVLTKCAKSHKSNTLQFHYFTSCYLHGSEQWN